MLECGMSLFPKVILASQSIQRQELFAALGIPFESIPADIDELAVDHADDAHRASLVAIAKGKAIAALNPTAIIVSADTFVVHDNQRLEKPESIEEAKEMLHRLSGKTFVAHTGWAIVSNHAEKVESGTVSTQVTFRPLSSIEVEKYVSIHPVTTWAGGFSIKNAAGISLVADIQGSLTGLLGLPIEVIQPILVRALAPKLEL